MYDLLCQGFGGILGTKQILSKRENGYEQNFLCVVCERIRFF